MLIWLFVHMCIITGDHLIFWKPPSWMINLFILSQNLRLNLKSITGGVVLINGNHMQIRWGQMWSSSRPRRINVEDPRETDSKTLTRRNRRRHSNRSRYENGFQMSRCIDYHQLHDMPWIMETLIFLWLWPQVATPDFTNFFACLGFIFFLSFCDCDSECTNLGPTNFWLWATPMTRYRAASRTRLASPHTQAKWIRVVFYLIIGRLRRGSRVRASYSLDLLREPTNFWFWLIWNRLSSNKNSNGLQIW